MSELQSNLEHGEKCAFHAQHRIAVELVVWVPGSLAFQHACREMSTGFPGQFPQLVLAPATDGDKVTECKEALLHSKTIDLLPYDVDSPLRLPGR